MGAFEPPAFSTSSIILDSVVSLPTLTARIFILPVRLSVADVISLPHGASTGRDSPVMAEQSSVVAPSVITPSHGTCSPGKTITVSPAAISSTDTVTVLPSRSTVAVSGRSLSSFSTSERVLPLDFASRNFPSVTSASIIAADSKNRFMASSDAPSTSPVAIFEFIMNTVTMP